MKPIISFWKQGKINNALEIIARTSNHSIIIDAVGAILQNNRFRSSVTPEVGIAFLKGLQ